MRYFIELYKDASNKGMLLLGLCILGMLWSLSPWRDYYFYYVNYSIMGWSIQHIINDFCMAIFFLLVGLEIKHEILIGHLRTAKQRFLPVIAAVFGVIVPVIFYCLFNYRDPIAMRGWAIPAATDIAFAVAMITVFGRRLPPSLKVFLTTLAIVDDVIAVLIIAFFYTGYISIPYLLIVMLLLVLLFIMQRKQTQQMPIYFAIGACLCFALLKSGIHSSISGVMLALFIPEKNVMQRMIKAISPWVQYCILPLFVLVNCAVHFSDVTIFNSITLGILCGLLMGKALGIFGSVFILYKSKIAPLPTEATISMLPAIAILCGIGFTMSLFIANLGFADYPILLNQAKIGVLIGSLLSAFHAWLLLRFFVRR